MKACRLEDLPNPPVNRYGWPWTEVPAPLQTKMKNGKPWPKISIVTPSFNQGSYLEETIRSVLLQGYPNLEYIIIDGGSTDESLEIIRKYEPWLSEWVSERDNGQSEAINKGFSKCTGEIFSWLCSDDFFSTAALATVVNTFTGGKKCDVLAGACICQYDNESGNHYVKSAKTENWELTPYAAGIWQPSCFFRRGMVERTTLVLPRLHYCMDRELWCYLRSRGGKWRWTEEVLSIYRFTGKNKSVIGRQKIIREIEWIFREYNKKIAFLPILLRKLWLPLVMGNLRHPSPLIRHPLHFVSRAVTMILLMLFPPEHVRALQKEFYVYSRW